MSQQEELTVEQMVASAPLVYIGKEWCPFCTKAKTSLEKAGARAGRTYKLYELEDKDRNPLVNDVGAIQDRILALYGSRSVPKVFLKGKMIGGGDDIVRLLEEGKLEGMLKEAGVIDSPSAGKELTVEEMVASAPLVYIGKMWCPFCTKAKTSIEKAGGREGSSYKIYELEDKDRNPLVNDVGAIQDRILALYGSRSVPKVFLKGKVIGGGDDIVRLLEEGKLEGMLKEAGVKTNPTVPEMVSSADLVYIGLAWCPYCKTAKQALEKCDVVPSDQYKLYELEDEEHQALFTNPDREAIHVELEKMYQSRTVPKVFLKGKVIGGSELLDEAQKSGKLAQMLKEAGIKTKEVVPLESTNKRYFLNGILKTEEQYKRYKLGAATK